MKLKEFVTSFLVLLIFMFNVLTVNAAVIADDDIDLPYIESNWVGVSLEDQNYFDTKCDYRVLTSSHADYEVILKASEISKKYLGFHTTKFKIGASLHIKHDKKNILCGMTYLGLFDLTPVSEKCYHIHMDGEPKCDCEKIDNIKVLEKLCQ
ncbi:hypothetical protein [Endozoicomonas numazuensis]|uniref:Calcium-dependent cell adhesion molecule N-terminal domain-containing protein n=1 Tax=Endozoicomonas numazuensis TaxID=1137799 RepID=A0A081NF46_9GAMM|nr:hypothetical protein [Endozoicomonas numazuensis]KEQ17069.1 hypothetical protein GZ78_14345 [Endozoicomonas numazuensis]